KKGCLARCGAVALEFAEQLCVLHRNQRRDLIGVGVQQVIVVAVEKKYCSFLSSDEFQDFVYVLFERSVKNQLVVLHLIMEGVLLVGIVSFDDDFRCFLGRLTN